MGHIVFKFPYQKVVPLVEEDEAKEENVKEVVESIHVQEEEEKSSLLSKSKLEKEIKGSLDVMASVVVEETKRRRKSYKKSSRF